MEADGESSNRSREHSGHARTHGLCPQPWVVEESPASLPSATAKVEAEARYKERRERDQ